MTNKDITNLKIAIMGGLPAAEVKYNVKQLVKEMVSEELYMLSNDKKIR